MIHGRDEIICHDVANRDVVVVGASAGGVQALQAFVGGLPPDLPATVLVVLHVPRQGPRALAAILDRAGPLPVAPAEHGQVPLPGRIYVAPSDHHLLLVDGQMQLRQDPPVNGHRPSIDALFHSAARAHRERLIAVVLSGAGDDGAAGLSTAAANGGIAIVQDPDQAIHPSMPRRARVQVPNALVRRAEEIGPLLGQLVSEAVVAHPALVIEPDGGEKNRAGIDNALWLALRALEERSALHARMARSRRAYGDEEMASRYEELATETDQAIGMIQRLMHAREATGVGYPVAG